jgi:hypothetical protein
VNDKETSIIKISGKNIICIEIEIENKQNMNDFNEKVIFVVSEDGIDTALKISVKKLFTS